jgi:hypothetical protein
MNYVESLRVARDQFILSIFIRGVFSGGAGSFESRLDFICLGPWSVGEDEFDKIDKNVAAWGLERISTQNLMISLDTALENSVPNRLQTHDHLTRDYYCFVRCLRNAFAHNPYKPKWNLKSAGYRRKYSLPGSWTVDLTNRDTTLVEDSDYRHAGGLIHLLDLGVEILRHIA